MCFPSNVLSSLNLFNLKPIFIQYLSGTIKKKKEEKKGKEIAANNRTSFHFKQRSIPPQTALPTVSQTQTKRSANLPSNRVQSGQLRATTCTPRGVNIIKDNPLNIRREEARERERERELTCSGSRR